MFVFQGVFFRTFYTTRTVKSVREEISLLKEKDDISDIAIEELLFSRNTQTITSIIPVSYLEENTDHLDLKVLEVETDGVTELIFAPNIEDYEYQEGQKISAITHKHDNGYQFPIYLSLDDETIIRSSISSDSEYISLIGNIDHTQQYQINGYIKGVSNNVIENSLSINSLVSNELLNITTKNYMALVNNEEIYYYFSNDSSASSANLVFYSYLNIDNTEHLLISVYQTDNISEIVRAAGTVNIYMFMVVLLILIIASLIYSREFSRPLLYINNATKKLSQLNFTEPLIKIESTDEFAELSRNINILTVNLKTTLYRLNEQNKQLSENLVKENSNEIRRREFVSGMSHELKTPLAVIQASAEALEHNIYDTKEDKDNALRLIQKEVSKTTKMIKSMMNVYKLDTANYEQEWKVENIKDILEGINSTLKLLYENKELIVEITAEDTYVLCNKDKIETVIINLFTNAIKYSPKGNMIKINLFNTKKAVVFEIANYGVSIDKSEITKIFDPFYRIEKARSRDEGSTGLGLYIVNQTLERYSSLCTVTSSNNSVRFSFKLKKVINPED